MTLLAKSVVGGEERNLEESIYERNSKINEHIDNNDMYRKKRNANQAVSRIEDDDEEDREDTTEDEDLSEPIDSRFEPEYMNPIFANEKAEEDRFIQKMTNDRYASLEESLERGLWLEAGGNSPDAENEDPEYPEYLEREAPGKDDSSETLDIKLKVSSVKDTEIVVQAPNDIPAGGYDLQVRVDNIGFALNSQTVTSELVVSSVTPTGGSVHGGTVITLSGWGFHKDTIVNMKGTSEYSCKILTVSGTKVTCKTTQAEAGEFDVMLSSGGSNITAGSFQYSENLSPNIDTVR